jgi:hypothetical protein
MAVAEEARKTTNGEDNQARGQLHELHRGKVRMALRGESIRDELYVLYGLDGFDRFGEERSMSVQLRAVHGVDGLVHRVNVDVDDVRRWNTRCLIAADALRRVPVFTEDVVDCLWCLTTPES